MVSQEHKEPRVLMANELATYLRCGRSTIHSLARAGKIPSIRIGKTGVRFDLIAVLEALKKSA